MKLVKEKEALVARLAQIERFIQKIEGDAAPPPQTKKTRKRRRGGRKAAILRALETAGAKGLALRQIAEKIGRSYASVRVWFSTTGRKLDSIEKIARATYRHVPQRG